MLTFEQIEKVANENNIEPCLILSIIKNETGSWLGERGYLKDGRPMILFESHLFWKHLKNEGKDPNALYEKYKSILTPRWNAEARSKYRVGAKEYERLDLAWSISKRAALKSASYGIFQLLGENYKEYGFEEVEFFLDEILENPISQVDIWLKYAKKYNILDALRNKDWARAARLYNGPGFEKNSYHTKLEKHYNECKNKRF